VKKGLILGLMVLMTMVAASAVQAITILPTETFYFTSNHITGGEGATVPFGEVVLTQNGLNVDFTVSLFNGNEFVRTGAGDLMDFKFNGTGVAVGDISGSGLTAATGALNGDGTGNFAFGVYITGQATGGGDARTGPIMFTVANATFADLTVANNLGNIFVADVILGANNPGTTPGKTGMVDASGTPQVPEPATMLLLGSGLIGLWGVRKKFKK
jgi:hypothetical protein